MPRVLLEIGHPGHVHFFRNASHILLKKGWDVFAYSRNKADCFNLLKREAIKTYMTREDNSVSSKFANLPGRSLSVAALARDLKVDVLSGVHPIYTSIASRLVRKPCIGFADTDHAKEQIIIYRTNCRKIYTPVSYSVNLGKKHRRYRGFHELSYLHPRYFKPDMSLIEESGVLDQGPPIVVRVIDWNATHDVGVQKKSWEPEFIDEFGRDHRIVISCEGEVPRNLREYLNPLPSHHFHHLLAFSKLCVGPGATTSSEAAMLGTPAVYTNPLRLGYIEQLQKEYGLVQIEREPHRIIEKARNMIQVSKSEYESRKQRLLAESCDVTQLVCKALEEYVKQ